MIQSETERQFYLSIAGVRLWYAREGLPGAAPSPEYDFAETEMSEGAELELPTPQAKPRRQQAEGARVANLKALMDKPAPERPQEGASRLAETVTPVSSEAPVEKREEGSVPAASVMPNLNLQFWVGQRFAVIASLSDEASTRLQETLAGNILKSLGDAPDRSVGPVCWPVFSNRRVPGSSQADLEAVLGHVLSGLNGQKVIALGADGSERDEKAGIDGNWLAHTAGISLAVSFQHTLAELAANPSFKRDLWLQLKPLAGK